MTASVPYHTLQLTRVDGTRFTYDIECNWRGTGWSWLARVVFDPYAETKVTRGGLSAIELSAIRGRLRAVHGRVCTVQLSSQVCS